VIPPHVPAVYPRISDLNQYLVEIRPLSFEVEPAPEPHYTTDGMRTKMLCDITVIHGQRSPFIIVRDQRFELPHTFEAMPMAAYGIVRLCLRLNRVGGVTRPAYGRVYRYELHSPVRSEPRRRAWAISDLTEHDERLVHRYLATRPRAL
jgi:hypothetical protein